MYSKFWKGGKMKKRYIFMTLAALLIVAAPLYAFMGMGVAKTVEDAMKLEDGKPVKLEGNSAEHLEEQFYLFTDDTGQILLEIPDEVIGDMQVDPEKKVRVIGKVARDDEAGTVSIKVENVKSIKDKDDKEKGYEKDKDEGSWNGNGDGEGTDENEGGMTY